MFGLLVVGALFYLAFGGVGGSGGSKVGHPTNRYYYDGSRASMPDYPNNKWHGGKW